MDSSEVTDAQAATEFGLDKTRLLDTQEVAAILNRAPNLLRRWRIQGGGPNWVKTGGRVFYRPSAVLAYLIESEQTMEAS